jgi:hypothetical protein
MSFVSKLVIAASLVFAQPAGAVQSWHIGDPPPKIAPEHDGFSEGTLRHGAKFGVYVGMPENEIDSILLPQNGEIFRLRDCHNRPDDQGCINADSVRTYIIHKYWIFTIPFGTVVEVSISGGKVEQINWWPLPVRM